MRCIFVSTRLKSSGCFVNQLKRLQQNRLAECNCQFRWGCQISKKGRKKRLNFHFKNSPPPPPTDHCVCLPVHFTCTGRMVRGFCFHGRCVRNTKVNKGPRWRSVTGGATCVYLCVWKYFAVPLNSILINSDESIKRSYSLYCLFQWVFTWYKQLF